MEQGKHDEALQKFVWCYDHGVEVNPKFARTRDTRVTMYLVSLGKKLPAARVALVERRDALTTKVKADVAKADKPMLQQLAYLDLAVSDDSAILENLKALASNKTANSAYAEPLIERLVEGKHYGEVVAADNFEEGVATLEKALRNVEKMRRAGANDEKAQAKIKASALKSVILIEAYAGAGEVKRAKQLGDLLIEICDDAEVRTKLAERLRRAGADPLAAKYAPKK
ncbi:MAG: hypothetical protein QM790_14915 [Nibricoccus sp.]